MLTLKLGSKVTQGHWSRHRSICHLTIYSNHGPISYCLQDRWRFQSKIAKKKSHPGVFCPTLTGSAWIWVSTQGSEKNGMMGLLDGPKSFKIGLAI